MLLSQPELYQNRCHEIKELFYQFLSLISYSSLILVKMALSHENDQLELQFMESLEIHRVRMLYEYSLQLKDMETLHHAELKQIFPKDFAIVAKSLNSQKVFHHSCD